MPGEELTGHCYFEALKWLDHHRLLIKVSGHTDEAPVRGFEHEYIFEWSSGRFEKPGTKNFPGGVSHQRQTHSGLCQPDAVEINL